MNINLNDKVEHILNLLNEYGEAYLVGGALRDLLLNLEPNDYDLATNISMYDIFEILSEYDITIKSEKYEVVSLNFEGINIEIARFRKEKGILDGRNPKEIYFVENIEEDLPRRDFTINAMAYNNTRGLIDIYNSFEDLKNKKIRIIGKDKELRLREDHSRIFRALTLLSKFDFSLSLETERAIYNFLKSNKISISNKNFIKLLDKILFEKYSYKSLKFILENNLLNNFIPELTIKALGEDLVKKIVDIYKVYCSYNAYEEKSLGYAIIFLFSGLNTNDSEIFLESMKIAEHYLKKMDINLSDIILVKNLIYYHNIVSKNLSSSNIKRILFEFRNNSNISKFLSYISYIYYYDECYNEIMKKTLELLSRIQQIYFNNEIVYINDLDINMVDLFNLKLNIIDTKEYLRKLIFDLVKDDKLENNKKKIIEYILEKYHIDFEIDTKYSSGAIVYRYNSNKELEFLLVKILGGNWGFPKGQIEENETSEMAAIREVKEETNLDIILEDKNKFYQKISYITNNSELKYVDFYLAKEFKNTVIIDEEEISEYKWLKYFDALKIITYSSQREVLQKARLYIFMEGE